MSDMAPSTDKANSFNLKGGVLIIGSLLWQDYLGQAKVTTLEKLGVLNICLLTIKLWLGFLFATVGFLKRQNFTMTFPPLSAKKFGTGYSVPLSRPNITTEEELFNEAIAMSNAEGMKGKFHANWGATLGLLFNEKKINKQLKEKTYGSLARKKLQRQISLIINPINFVTTKHLVLNQTGYSTLIGHCRVITDKMELLNSYDFILATAAQPTGIKL